MSFLGSEVVEVFNFEVLNDGVEFLLGILILVSATIDSNTNSAGDVSNTVHPDGSVETVVDSHVLGVHFFGGETFDVSDTTGSSFLELDSMESLVKMKSVISASGLHFFSLSVLSPNVVFNLKLNYLFKLSGTILSVDYFVPTS